MTKHDKLATTILITILIVALAALGILADRAFDFLEQTTHHYFQVYVEPALAEPAEPEETKIVLEYRPLPVDYENIGTCTVSDTDATYMAKTLYGEYNNPNNYGQSAAVCWCILNRVDSGLWGDTVEDVVTASGQFHGYRTTNPVDADLYNIAVDVLLRYELEKLGLADVGRVLPKEYIYFGGNGVTNTYRDTYSLETRNKLTP